MLDKLKKTILSEFLGEEATIGDTTSLFRGGLLDSVDLVRLVSLLEETYSISIHPREIVPQNFDSLQAIRDFLHKKL